MTKAEVVSIVAKKTGHTMADVSNVLEAFFTTVKDSMSEGNNIYVRGFGSFTLKKHLPKQARDLYQNKIVVIPERYSPAFKPAERFKEAVKNSEAAKKLLKA